MNTQEADDLVAAVEQLKDHTNELAVTIEHDRQRATLEILLLRTTLRYVRTYVEGDVERRDGAGEILTIIDAALTSLSSDDEADETGDAK